MSRENIVKEDSKGDVLASPKSKWFGFKYRVNPETSKALQEAVFKDGGKWNCGSQHVICTDKGYLFITELGFLSHSSYENTFKENDLPEKEIMLFGGELIETHSIPTGDTAGFPNYTSKMIFNNKEEKQTMARKLVTVNLWDDDKGLDVENSLVYSFDKVLTEDDSETTIRQVIADHDIGKIIESHNKIRKEHTNKDILNRTGQSVPLEPVKLKNLRWEIVG